MFWERFWERSVDMQQKQVSYLHMFNVFFKIGLFTIGGGLAMIPLIRDEFVERQGWIDDKDITDVLAIAQSLPGVIAVNSATFLGYRLAGIMGALVCTIGVVLPSFLIIFAIAMLFASSGLDSNTYILKFFAGVNAAITVLLVVATKKMFASSVSNKLGCFFRQQQTWVGYTFNFRCRNLRFGLWHCLHRYRGSAVRHCRLPPFGKEC